ncbi:MAG: Mu transposase C-terminal domain-containing protein [Lachnospiraceae bacterium]|nr:Mu transposase C-terminal domain-containing protein [Lachnospiraceae bacterium]
MSNDSKNIQVKQVVLDLSARKAFRVLWISPDYSYGYWIDPDGKSNIPEKFSPAGLEAGIADGTFEYIKDTWMPCVSESDIPFKWKQRRGKAYGFIEKAVRMEPEIYDRNCRRKIADEISENSPEPISLPSLYGYLGRYWKRGMVPNALLPDYDHTGKTRDVYKGSAKRSGRKKRAGAAGKKLTNDDIRHFSDAVSKYYLTPEHSSFKSSYSQMLKEWYSVKRPDGEVDILPPDDIPSFRQYQNWYFNNRDRFQEIKKRDGQKALDLKYRGLNGKTEEHLYGPGDAVQIDATIADIYLVSQNDRSMIVGRPAMYFVMDAYSHMVTGMHITLNNPSWETESLAIRNSATNKVDYCKCYGIDITPEEWLCFHIPRSIIGDRGELESSHADVLANELGIQVINTPPYRGDLKGIIEQHFRTVNIDMTNTLPGKAQPDFGQRGGHDYRLDAKLDLHQFTAIIIRCVLHYNNRHYMEGYTRDMQMRSLGVRPVPLELWNYGIRYRSGGLQVVDENVMNAALLPRSEASITGKGICFRRMYYTCPQAEEEDWFARARVSGAEKITVSYDPTDMDRIFVRPKAGAAPVLCHLKEHESMYRGLSEAELDRIHEADLDEKAAFEHTELDSRAKLNSFIDKKTKEAEDLMKNACMSKSKTERLSDINANRRSEIEAELEWQTKKSMEIRGAAYDAADIRKKEKTSAPATSQRSADIVDRMIAEQIQKVLPDIQFNNSSES